MAIAEEWRDDSFWHYEEYTLAMKFLSPNADKTLYVLFMAFWVVVLWAMLSELLVSAIAPVKPPYFTMVFIGLVGLILLCVYLAVHRIIHHGKPLPVWISAVGVLFILMAAIGTFINAFSSF